MVDVDGGLLIGPPKKVCVLLAEGPATGSDGVAAASDLPVLG